MPSGAIDKLTEDSRSSVILGGRYVVELNGDVWDRVLGHWCDYHNDSVVLICHKQELVFSRPLLIALTTRRVVVDISVIHLLDVLFEDDNPCNVMPQNLILKYPDGGLPCPHMPGFYYVPGYSNYVINT